MPCQSKSRAWQGTHKARVSIARTQTIAAPPIPLVTAGARGRRGRREGQKALVVEALFPDCIDHAAR